MIINGDWKNKVRNMRANGDSEGAKKELRKAYLCEMNNLDLYTDKYFILFALAHLHYKENDKIMSNYYLSELFEISDSKIQKDFEEQYHNITWLNINVNHEDMDSKEIICCMTNAYNYYMALGVKDVALSALENIFFFEENEEKILESLDELLKCKKIRDFNFVTSILNDCEKLNHNLYIRALRIVNKYEVNIDVV